MATTSSNLLVTTPRPTAAPNTRIHTGRGGAGNTFRAAPSKASSSSSVSGSASASAPAPTAASSAGPSTARTAAPSSSTRRFYSGIGDAGNEEIARARAREKSGVGRVGIGGAGNIFRRKKKEEQQQGHGDHEPRIEGERKGSLWSLGSWESVIKEQKA
ncbi:hypothetical protein HYQ46_000875 [Verticillium longisporum]|nr:hypothetical protein HYQ46_000875 [Verticillium longisporum]